MSLIYPSGNMTDIPIYVPDGDDGDGGKGPNKGGSGFWKVFVILCVGALVTFWGITTLLQWLDDPFKSPSLEEVLMKQWKWAQSITLTEAQKEEREWVKGVEMMTRFAEQLPGYEPFPGEGNEWRSASLSTLKVMCFPQLAGRRLK